jgi:hypothetical protein
MRRGPKLGATPKEGTQTMPEIAQHMPSLLAHAGVWVGTYRHLNVDGSVFDTHGSHVTCEFPETGPYAYVQHNVFTWPDGRTQRASLPAIYRDGALWWDNDSFHGKAWETHAGLILLELWRKDVPGAWFWEMICLAPGSETRARTWHWFDAHGQLFRRTLCDERRVDSAGAA